MANDQDREPNEPIDDASADATTVFGDAGALRAISAAHGDDIDPGIELERSGTSAPDPAATVRARYTIGPEIARGGMGAIHVVRDVDLRRSLAMKVLLGGTGSSRVTGGPVARDHLNRFLEEAQVTAQLTHPGVVPVHELGIDAEGRVFFTMDLVRGKTLSEVIELARREADGWTTTRALQVVLGVCQTLAFAHDKGVIHRDIKPANVMVGRFGEAYLMDWGLAKVLGRADAHDIRPRHVDASPLSRVESNRNDSDPEDSPIMTMDGAAVGTPAYMAPEQAAGRAEEVDKRSDVYAVGALLYQLLTGQPPYVPPGSRISPRTVLVAVIGGPPTPVLAIVPTAPEELQAICAKAMARDRDERYASAEELAGDLQNYLSGHVVRAHRTGALIEMRKWIARNRLAAALLLIIAAGLIVGFGVTLHLLGRSRESEQQSREDERKAAAAEIEARQAEDKARTAERSSRHALYRATIGLVAADLDRGSHTAAREGLRGCDPDQRGWEWGVLTARTQRMLGRIRGTAPAFDPATGRLLVARCEETQSIIESWDLGSEGPETIATVTGTVMGLHPRLGYAVIAEGGGTSVVRLPAGDLVYRVDGQVAAGTPVLVGDPDRVLMWLHDRGLHIADLTTGREWAPPRTRKAGILSVSPSGELLARGGETETSVLLLDATTLEVRQTLEGLDNVTLDAVFTWDDRQVLLRSTLETWDRFDTQTGEPVGSRARRLPGGGAVVRSAAFAPDGRRFAYATVDRTIQVVDTDPFEIVAVWRGHDRDVETVAFSPDGTSLVSADGGGTVLVWPNQPSTGLDVLTEHSSFVYGAAFSPDGSLIASGGWDGFVHEPGCLRIVDALTGDHIASWGDPEERVFSVEFLPDGERLLTLIDRDDDDIFGAWLSVWDVRTGELLRTFSKQVSAADIDATGTRIAATFAASPEHPLGARLGIIDVSSGEITWVESGDNRLRWATRFLDGGRRVAAQMLDGSLGVWDTQTLERTATLTGPRGDVVRIAQSPDGRHVAAAADGAKVGRVEDSAVHVWDARTGEPVAQLRGHGAGALTVSFSHDGARIATGGRDGAVHVWDAGTFEKIVSLTGHEGYVYRVEFDLAGDRLVSVGEDGTVRLWETTEIQARRIRARARDAVVRRLAPGIRERLDADESPADVVDAIEARTDLTPRERGIAFQILLAECVQSRTR